VNAGEWFRRRRHREALIRRGETMNAWVYKVNSRRPGAFTGWHFDRFFRSRSRAPHNMGGHEWIRSPQSWTRLRRVRPGDLFLCYQSDERKIYGLARANGAGYESLPGSGIFDSVDFEPGGLRLRAPVPVTHRAASAVFQHVGAFTVPSRGTIHPLRRDELQAVLSALVKFNPSQRRAIERFASRQRLERRPRRDRKA
jgi:hypothetical protein